MPEEWENLFLKPLIGGYDVSVIPSLLPKGSSPHIENFVFERGRLEIDRGYSPKGSAVRGTPRLVMQYNKQSGVSEILLITNDTLYKWAIGEWQYIASSVSTTADGGEPAAETDLLVADDAGFSDGDYIGVILDNGTQHQTTINGAPAANVITMTDAVPAGRSIADGAAVVLACVFSGQDNKPVTYDHYPGNDSLVISNSTDNVQIYDGSSCEDIPNLVTACGGASAYAGCVRVKDNKVLLFNMSESGTDYPQRVRWSGTGDHTDWTTSGDAGYEDLYDSEDHIIVAERLGPYIFVYRTESVYRMEYVGTAELIYNFERMLGTDGAASAHSVLRNKSTHIVMGSQGFYAYAGGLETEEFGQQIFEKIYGDLSTLNQTYKGNIYCHYIDSLKRYFFMLPSDGESKPSRTWIYDIRTKSWTTRVFADTILSMTEVEFREGNAWIDQTTAWEHTEWNVAWNDPSRRVGEPGIFMAGIQAGSNYVFEYSDSDTDDDGTTITGEFQTGELHYPGYKIRIDRIRVVGKGTLTVSYSEDEGDTWTSYGTATCGSDYSIQDIWKQLTVDRIMFKFTGSSVGLDTIQVFWKIETEF